MEVVVSIGIAVILAIFLITTSLITQKSSRSARNNTQATKLVQQTLEQLRVYRDRHGFDALPAAAANICIDFNADTSDPSSWSWTAPDCSSSSFEPVPNTIFSRQIVFLNQGPSNEKRLITVTARWDESGQTQSVKSQTILGLWEESP